MLPLNVTELFCGVGGTSLGLQRAGFHILHGYDVSYPAVKTHRKNFKRYLAWPTDLREIFEIGYIQTRLRVNMISGSPPCQDFSKAGERVEKANAMLTHAYSMIVAVVRPEWLLMENVPEAAKSKVWKDARRLLKWHGYGLTEMTLNAALYGVPQARKRLIVVGRLGERDGFMSSALKDAASAKPMPVRAMLRPEIPEDRALLDTGYYYMRPYTGGRGVQSIDAPSPTVIRTAAGKPGPKYLNNPHPKDPIPAAQAHVLTLGQVSRIQGFPSDWDWSLMGNKNNISQAIANAVPPGLAEAVGRVILARHHGETIPAVADGFVDWLCRHGKSRQAALNTKANVNRARRLLGGRTYADSALEIGRLETADGFGSLSTQVKSDLRAALRLHAEWQAA